MASGQLKKRNTFLFLGMLLVLSRNHALAQSFDYLITSGNGQYFIFNQVGAVGKELFSSGDTSQTAVGFKLGGEGAVILTSPPAPGAATTRVPLFLDIQFTPTSAEYSSSVKLFTSHKALDECYVSAHLANLFPGRYTFIVRIDARRTLNPTQVPQPLQATYGTTTPRVYVNPEGLSCYLVNASSTGS